MPCDPAISLLNDYLIKMLAHVHKETGMIGKCITAWSV